MTNANTLMQAAYADATTYSVLFQYRPLIANKEIDQ
jgi:hypothetical protein